MTTKTQQDLIGVIVADHRAIQAAFEELQSGTGEPRRRRELADHVITELVRHSVGEEQYLYPVARKALRDGEQIVDHDLEEHAEAEQLMKQLEGLAPTSPEFEELVEKLVADLSHHLREEERDLLPRLQGACDHKELVELGEKFERARRMAPTRPHPSVPDKPPANKLLAPGAGLIDRLRDALSGHSS
jgi:hemerythrin superfamily protein